MASSTYREVASLLAQVDLSAQQAALQGANAPVLCAPHEYSTCLHAPL